MNADALAQAVAPLPKDRVKTLRTLLHMTDTLRAHVLGGRIETAAAVQTEREALLRQFFSEAVKASERVAMVEACCAMLDMDHAVLDCLEINRSQVIAGLAECSPQHPLETRP
ncbi:MAG: hypothetical protein V4709_08635 [Pseudomonadota bacterium]